jgi:bacteriophage N4 adsorption protein B
MSDLALTLAAGFHIFVREALLLVAVGFLVCGLDDLFVDLTWIGRSLWRRATIYRRHARASAESLRRPDPGAIAIVVPAWDEGDVIGSMLANLTRRLDYPRYRVFVGLYPNDPRGEAAVAAVGDHRIQPVMCSRPGPTTKADCLNHLWRAVLAYEAATTIPFKALVLHDAEDVVHPQELWVYDALIPRLAMVQLPVLPLPDPASPWISGHYLDEFAESHAKDLVVREALGAAVPSAGVATAIERDMLGRISAAAGGQPFDATCLTEDYELGHRIKALGGRAALVRIRSGAEQVMVATQEHFPATFADAVRQKSRWLTGIALAGWDRLGWPGGLADRYMLLRDRKALAAALLTMAGYALAGLVIVDALLLAMIRPAGARVETALPALLSGNAALLAWRLLMRAGFTAYAYGPAQGLLAIPRAFVGNLVNAAAAWVATRRYRGMLQRGGPLAWEKTTHRYPGG